MTAFVSIGGRPLYIRSPKGILGDCTRCGRESANLEEIRDKNGEVHFVCSGCARAGNLGRGFR